MQNNTLSTSSLDMTVQELIEDIENLSNQLDREKIEAKIIVSRDLYQAILHYLVENFYTKYNDYYPIGYIHSIPIEIDSELKGYDWGLRERRLDKCKTMTF